MFSYNYIFPFKSSLSETPQGSTEDVLVLFNGQAMPYQVFISIKTVGYFVDNFQNTFRFSFNGVYIQQSQWDLNPVTLIWEEKQRILEVVVKWRKIAICDACYGTKARLHLSIYYIEFSESDNIHKIRRKFPETREPKLSVFEEKEEHAWTLIFT